MSDDDVEYLENVPAFEFEVVLDEETWKLARQLAARDGVSTTDAIRRALRRAAAGA